MALVPLVAEPFSEGAADDFFTAEGLRLWAILLRLGAGGPSVPFIFPFCFIYIYPNKYRICAIILYVSANMKGQRILTFSRTEKIY